MKTTINYFGRMLCALLCAGFVVAGCYDDSALQKQLQDHESRLKELERLTAQQNTNISSLQTIVTALQDKDYVTSVAPINEGDEVVGYTITFSKSGAVTIHNGKDGYVPALGVKQESEGGVWYWTVDGEWLLDSKGGKVRASAEDGEDGAPGQSGVTPQLKIVDGYWYVSYDGGKTWEEETLGQATGDKGYTMFAEVTYDEEYLYITMADGEKLTLPRTSESQDEGEEQEGLSQVGPVKIRLSSVTLTTATFTGSIDASDEALDYIKVMVRYSRPDSFSAVDETLPSVVATKPDFNDDKTFSITLLNLDLAAEYKYCIIIQQKNDKKYSEVSSFATPPVSVELDVESNTQTTVQFKGKIDPSTAIDEVQIAVLINTSETVTKSDYSKKYTLTSEDIKEDGSFDVSMSGLKSGTKYYYCSYVKQGDGYVYGEVKTFDTSIGPLNLSATSTANCYIVPESDVYKFKPVKGNSATSVGSVSSVAVLWESFGTNIKPNVGDLIKSVSYKDGYIAFQTADTFKEGNAVIAAKDADGNILWSWHIWFTDQPQAHVYNNDAGTMMDRNLGATSATKGDVGALGLLYQWGRKDPFLGSSSISSSTNLAKSTITWPSKVSSNSSNGTIEYATAHPTTFITQNSNNDDWYYTSSSSTDNTRWTTSSNDKSIYDPCPAGWRVPDGGSNGIWSKAGFDDTTYDRTNEGISFSISSPSTTWYPASGYRGCSEGGLHSAGYDGHYWSASPYSFNAYGLYFFNNGDVGPSNDYVRANGFSVRCLQESK